MSSHLERLNTWHLDLAITADALEHVLMAIEEPVGLSATAYILRRRLAELVDSCPFAAATPATSAPEHDFDLDDFDGSLPDDLAGVPAELLTGGRDD